MLRASRALRRDERHIELRPWLFRLVRNCALDELARVRTDSVALDDADDWGMLRAPAAMQPEAASEQRGKIRNLLVDISSLPVPQRHALLRREVDGISHAALAAELGVSEQATKNLVHRARTNLVKHEEARSTDCQDVRVALLKGHDEGRRASAAAYRHVATCRTCRSFRAGLKDTSRAVAMLAPAPLLLVAIGLLAGKVGAAGAKGAMLKTGATAAAGAALAAGVVVGGLEVFRPGDPAPQSAKSIALAQGHVVKGARLPARTAMIRRTLRFAPARRAPSPRRCSWPARRACGSPTCWPWAARGVEYPDTIVGWSRTARVRVTPLPAWPRHGSTSCARCPTRAARSWPARPLTRARPMRRVNVARTELLVRPGGAALGSVRFGHSVRDARPRHPGRLAAHPHGRGRHGLGARERARTSVAVSARWPRRPPLAAPAARDPARRARRARRRADPRRVAAGARRTTRRAPRTAARRRFSSPTACARAPTT